MLLGVIDVPVMAVLGAFSALLYRRRLRPRSPNWYAALTGLFVAVFWLNVAAANLWSTPYWLVGTPVASLGPAVGIPLVLSYPLWFRAAGEATFVLLGRRPDQGGLLWVFRLSDRTDPIETPWERSDSGGGIDRSGAGEATTVERDEPADGG